MWANGAHGRKNCRSNRPTFKKAAFCRPAFFPNFFIVTASVTLNANLKSSGTWDASPSRYSSDGNLREVGADSGRGCRNGHRRRTRLDWGRRKSLPVCATMPAVVRWAALDTFCLYRKQKQERHLCQFGLAILLLYLRTPFWTGRQETAKAEKRTDS